MIRPLRPSDTRSVQRALMQAPLVNLFLLHCLEVDGLERAVWSGRWLGKQLVAVAYLVPGRLCVPWASEPEHAQPLGAWLRNRYPPCLMVGPRATCDALWRAWASDTRPAVWYDQHLYVIHRVSDTLDEATIRLAEPSDCETVAEHSAAYASEDLGKYAPDSDPKGLQQVVMDRIHEGRTYVIEHGGELVFHVHVGAHTSHGCMVGGTYVPPKHRGRGFATQGMRQVVRRLLRRWPAVALHVNEANPPAVKVYQNVGFSSHAAYRLAMPTPNS